MTPPRTRSSASPATAPRASTPLHIERQGAQLHITLDRPTANAIDCRTSWALYQTFAQFERDPQLQVAILSGAGERFFSAGWDLKVASAGEAVDADHGPGGFAGLTEFFSRSKPVIAAVNGMAVGGGFELVLACDLVVAAEHASFFLPEGQIGIAPDAGGVFRLPARLPRPIAMEMLLTGKRMSAGEALSWGLVNQVCSGAVLLAEATALAERVIATAPLAQRAIGELVEAGAQRPMAEAFAAQRSGRLSHYRRMLDSGDSREGAEAFVAGRAPQWSGR